MCIVTENKYKTQDKCCMQERLITFKPTNHSFCLQRDGWWDLMYTDSKTLKWYSALRTCLVYKIRVTTGFNFLATVPILVIDLCSDERVINQFVENGSYYFLLQFLFLIKGLFIYYFWFPQFACCYRLTAQIRCD